tara:strand:- start:543 stop:1034 length:492 start_codon:yes stop_codon:yes gene_type:complete
MVILDISILIFIAFWSIRGFLRGFSAEIISLIIWVFAIYMTINYFYLAINYIEEYIVSREISIIITYVLIFIFTLLISTISGFVVSKFMKIIGFYSFEKSLGFIFGAIKGISFVFLITFFLMNTEFSDHRIISDSQFIPYFEYFLKNYLNSSDSLFDSFRLKI